MCAPSALSASDWIPSGLGGGYLAGARSTPSMRTAALMRNRRCGWTHTAWNPWQGWALRALKPRVASQARQPSRPPTEHSYSPPPPRRA